MKLARFIMPSFLACLLLAWLNRLVNQTFAKAPREKKAAKGAPYADIDAAIEAEMRRYHIPGLFLAIVDGERIAHLRGFGRARPDGGPPLPQTPFFIGSLTKSMTALAVMQLVEAGKIKLEAPVQQYLPWFRVADPQASAQITVHHLLNQTSGLPGSRGLADLGNMDDRPDEIERQVRALATVKLNHPVGANFEYNNTNYNILGLIIEAASDETYAAYIQKHIFDPLDMTHTYTSKAAAQRDGLAVGHRYWFGRPIPATRLSIPPGSLPSGQLIASAIDMAHYLIANLNGGRYGDKQILSEAGMAELHRGEAEIRVAGRLIGTYGLGWISQDIGELTIVSHSGIVPDYGAVMALVPELQKGIVLLFNANHAIMKIPFDEFGMGAAQRLAGLSPKPSILRAAPWLMRGLLLIPILQLASLLISLRLFTRWRRQDPAQRPRRIRMGRPSIVFPLIINLLTAATLIPMLSDMRGFIKLFMPDFSWIALICGSLAGLWTFLHTFLVLQTRAKLTPKDAP